MMFHERLRTSFARVRTYENSNLQLEGEPLRRIFKFPRENLNFQRRIKKFSGKLKSSAEKQKVSLENRNVQPKIQILGGKRNRQPENQNVSRIFGSLAENSKVQLKI
jgi:hypothetical protein